MRTSLASGSIMGEMNHKLLFCTLRTALPLFVFFFLSGTAWTEEKGKPAEPPAELMKPYREAHSLMGSGKAAEAEAIQRPLVEEATKTMGPYHPFTIFCRMDYAATLRTLGKFPEAEKEYRFCWQSFRQVAPDDRRTLSLHSALAEALHEERKEAEAEKETRAVLQDMERVLGAEHPMTLATRGTLAAILSDEGQHDEAEKELRAIIKTDQRVLGPDKMPTLMSRGNLAITLRESGKQADAEAEFSSLVKDLERVFGADDPNTLTFRYHYAICLKQEKKFSDAEKQIRLALASSTKLLGPEHPNTKLLQKLLKDIQDSKT